MLQELLQIPDDARIISICGAGGKTTLLHMLAREYAAAGKKTVILTTTHIRVPNGPDITCWTNHDESFPSKVWAEGHIVCAGTFSDTMLGKCTAPSAAEYAFLEKEADCMIIEADGANRLPFKYPAVWEPVIGLHTDKVIVVAGLSALNKPVDEICHRAYLVRRDLDLAAEILGPTEMALILSSGYGRYRPTVLLNQADTPEQKKRGQEVRSFLLEVGIPHVVITSLEQLNGGPAYRR